MQAYIFGREPEDFLEDVVGYKPSRGCWASVYKDSRLPRVWTWTGPKYMGSVTIETEKYFDLYTKTFARMVFENWSNFYGILYNVLDVPHTFVDIGKEYPILVGKYNEINYRITHVERIWWDTIGNAANTGDYEEFLDIIGTYGAGGNGHVALSKRSLDMDGRDLFDLWHNPEIATIVATQMDKRRESYNMFKNSIKEAQSFLKSRV